MTKKSHNYIAVAVSTLVGALLIYFGTDGLQAFTAESARTYRLMQENPVFPDVGLEDSMERTYPISEFEGKYIMATFIYTACTDVCPALEMNLAAVYEQIPEKYIGEDIIFLSISFDPDRDDPETLNKYRMAFGSDGETWRMARVTDKTELNDLLDAFGVIVLPDGNGGFAHNSAFYFVEPGGALLEVMDYEQVDTAAEKVMKELKNNRG